MKSGHLGSYSQNVFFFASYLLFTAFIAVVSISVCLLVFKWCSYGYGLHDPSQSGNHAISMKMSQHYVLAHNTQHNHTQVHGNSSRTKETHELFRPTLMEKEGMLVSKLGLCSLSGFAAPANTALKSRTDSTSRCAVQKCSYFPGWHVRLKVLQGYWAGGGGGGRI